MKRTRSVLFFDSAIFVSSCCLRSFGVRKVAPAFPSRLHMAGSVSCQNSKRIVTPDNLQSDAFQAVWLIILAVRFTSRGCMWPIRHVNDLSQIIYDSSCLFFTVDQETMCAGFNSSLASQNMTLLDCNVECCSGNNCNIQNLTTREYTSDTLVDVSGTSD